MSSYPTAKALAATYTVRTHEHPYDIVKEYDRVMRVASKHPQKGSSAISSMVDLPRSRIRLWVDGDGKPDAVRGIETAREHGWLDADLSSDTFRALNRLAAGVYSGGSIDRRFVPSFSPDKGGIVIVRIRDALRQIGTEPDTRADDDPSRTTELHPTIHGAVLGRVLAALGVPQGDKNDTTDISLPEYLDDAPDAIRRDFVSIYVWNRASRPSTSDLVQIMESRPKRFFRNLGNLIAGVAGVPVSVKEDKILIPAEAARNLNASRADLAVTE